MTVHVEWTNAHHQTETINITQGLRPTDWQHWRLIHRSPPVTTRIHHNGEFAGGPWVTWRAEDNIPRDAAALIRGLHILDKEQATTA